MAKLYNSIVTIIFGTFLFSVIDALFLQYGFFSSIFPHRIYSPLNGILLILYGLAFYFLYFNKKSGLIIGLIAIIIEISYTPSFYYNYITTFMYVLLLFLMYKVYVEWE